MGIKVKAIDKGFYGGVIRRPDDEEMGKKADVFEIKSEEEFSGRWMERVGKDRDTLSMKKGA